MEGTGAALETGEYAGGAVPWSKGVGAGAEACAEYWLFIVPVLEGALYGS